MAKTQTITVEQIGSPIRRTQDQRATLVGLGLNKIRLMMWSDRKIAGLEGFGIEVVERIPIPGRAPAKRREAQSP